MKKYNSMRVRLIGIVAPVIVALTTAVASAQEADPGGKWHFSAGIGYRGGMKAEASGSSRVQQEGIQAARNHPMTAPLNADNITQQGNRTFDDGFVNTDIFTTLDGKTINWGYQNASQYNSAANTMTYQRMIPPSSVTRSVSVTTDRNTDLSTDDHFDAAGLVMRLTYDLLQRQNMSLSLAVDLRGYWNMEQSLHGSTFQQTINEKTFSVVDTYVYGTDPNSTIPPAPYFGGTNPSTDPLINNVPTSATRSITQTRSSVWHAANDIMIDLNSDLYQIGLGPQFELQPIRRLRVNVEPSVLLNYIRTDVTRNETFVATYGDGSMTTLNSWQDSYSDSKWAMGLGLQGGVNLGLTESWSISLDAGYEYVDKVHVDCGPNKVSLDLSAYTLSASLVRSF